MEQSIALTFVHDEVSYQGTLIPLSENDSSFSLHVSDVWVATINYTDKWIMDGIFTKQAAFIGAFIEHYFSGRVAAGWQYHIDFKKP